MTEHIDYRSHSSAGKDFTLELEGGLLSFNGRITTSAPHLDRYIAVIHNSKKLIRHYKIEKRAEILILGEPESVVFSKGNPKTHEPS